MFADAAPLAVSIETRKEVGEPYSAALGFFRRYELVYVVADERDLIGVRTNVRADPPEDVYVYRVAMPKEAARRLLLDRCVRWTRETLPEDVADGVEAAMESVAPAGAVEMAIRCGECGALTTAALDLPALLWAEVEAQATRLLHDVDALARRYGWNETDVLALSPRRRAAYLELAGA